jgi:hypothetical protein
MRGGPLWRRVPNHSLLLIQPRRTSGCCVSINRKSNPVQRGRTTELVSLAIKKTMLEVTDDSGFLALVVPATYESFVAKKWTLDQIMAHFKGQMVRRSLLIWGTGLEGFWKVVVVMKETNVKGYREVRGPLQVVGGSLLLTNYESLTMAAQYSDVTLPEKHQVNLLVSIPDGEYTCRIIQMFDPEQDEIEEEDAPGFVIEVLKATGNTSPWESIPWFKTDG